MPRRIALLRAVNVGGGNRVGMADLRNLLTDLGFSGVQTVLQTGNLVFDGAGIGTAALEALLERELRARLGLSTEVLVRSAAEWAAIVAGNPFTKAAASDPAHLVVMPLKGEADPAAVAALRESIAGPELLHAEGRQAYIVYPAGIGRSKLTMAKLERGLGSRGTGRNWNTVLKLAALAGA